MSTIRIRHFSIYRDEDGGNMQRISDMVQYRPDSLEHLRRQYIRYRTNALHGYFLHSVAFPSGEVYRPYGVPDPDDYEIDWGAAEDDWGDDE